MSSFIVETNPKTGDWAVFTNFVLSDGTQVQRYVEFADSYEAALTVARDKQDGLLRSGHTYVARRDGNGFTKDGRITLVIGVTKEER